jgi:hypothetical protein
MPEFLAETYTPRGIPGTAAPRAGDALAAEQASGPEGLVRFLGAIAVPEEETCFWLYQAPSAGAVHAAMTRAGLRPERITPAVPLRPPAPALRAGPEPSVRAGTRAKFGGSPVARHPRSARCFQQAPCHGAQGPPGAG